MKKYITIIGLLALAILASGCARDIPIPHGDYTLMGFWAGVWDGTTAWIALIGGLFGQDWAVYDIMNKGALYDWGFLAGAGGSTTVACRCRQARRRR